MQTSAMADIVADLWGRFREASTIVQVGCATAGTVALIAAYKRATRDARAPPRYSPGIPVIGGTVAFLKEPLEFITAGYNAKGGIFVTNIFTKEFCFLLGPEPHHAFYNNNDAVLNQSELYKFSVPVFGKGVVFDVDYPVRKQQLHFVKDRFGLKAMESYVNTVEDEAKPFWEELVGRGKPVNIREEMFELLMRTSTSCLMGVEVRAMLKSGVADYLHDLEMGMQSYSAFAPYVPTPRHRKRDASRKALGALFQDVITERRRMASKPGSIKHQDMVDKFLHAKYSPGGETLTDEEITGLCIAAFFGGMHNSAITTVWTLLFVFHHREYLPRLKAEQQEVRATKGPGDPLAYKDLNAMPLLKACVKEALRLRPPLVLLMRTVKSPIDACGYKIAAGTVVVTCPPVAHRIADVFPDPEVYNPDRWLDPERPEANLKPHSFIAFGDGARRCLGETLGYLQVMTIVSHVLENYDIELVEKTLPRAGFQGMVVGPEGDCLGTLRRISGK